MAERDALVATTDENLAALGSGRRSGHPSRPRNPRGRQMHATLTRRPFPSRGIGACVARTLLSVGEGHREKTRAVFTPSK